MAKYRCDLPTLSDQTFLSDSGLETDLIFHEGFDLPLFASFTLLEDEEGTEALRRYYLRHTQVAQNSGVGFVLEAATWRASRDWASQLGYTEQTLADANRRAVGMLVDLRAELGEVSGPTVISAPVGPRGDAYNPAQLMTSEEAQHYHSEQIGTLADTDADLITAFTITHAAEAIGIVRAAQETDMPVVISFTVETDGALPDDSRLMDTVLEVDQATDFGPAYYGINCAHPTHFTELLDPSAEWTRRIQMIRANASRMSHADLDEAEDLDDGDPQEFGREYAQILERFPQINVLGGCCGTDVRHVQAVALACVGGSD